MNSTVATPAAARVSSRAIGFFLAALGAILFSGKAIVVKFTYEYGVDAVTLIAFRMLFSLPFFAVIGWQQARRAGRGEIPVLTRAEHIRVVILGLIGYYLSSFLDFLGLRYISVGLERLILFLAPTLVLLITAFWLKRVIAMRQWVALFLSYAGVVLVFAHDVAQTGRDAVLLGSAFVFASAFTYALYLIGSGELVKRVGSIRLTAYAMSVSSVASLIQFFVVHPASTLIQPMGFYGLSLIHATVNTVLPVFMIMGAVSRIGPPLASQLGMLGPVSVLFLAFWFLGEPITSWQLAGTGLVLAGVFVLTGRRVSTPRRS
ncbi:DMT family transporter [Bordetella flabilis]|uniref:Multidrug DMT transporter permease n=1 Tax=Bordetella flabilis TaxID=463014 RepID=A0A193GDD3_9BORD|nr:DMT family transporter [Bordetella flabilis]ANN77289.1 multidrug DMT transporter permease [Bordetella flabilis]